MADIDHDQEATRAWLRCVGFNSLVCSFSYCQSPKFSAIQHSNVRCCVSQTCLDLPVPSSNESTYVSPPLIYLMALLRPPSLLRPGCNVPSQRLSESWQPFIFRPRPYKPAEASSSLSHKYSEYVNSCDSRISRSAVSAAPVSLFGLLSA